MQRWTFGPAVPVPTAHARRRRNVGCQIIYREIVPNKRLVWVHSFADAQGNTVKHPMSDTWPLEMLSTVTFEADAGGTLVTIHMEPINPTDEERAHTFTEGIDSMNQGWGRSLDILRDYLSEAD
ncbi:MAG: SRPBCC domain-containing protein [Phycisphaerales bacterium]